MKKRFYISIIIIALAVVTIAAILYINRTQESLDIRDEAATTQVLAFPTAEGFGAQTPGGRGGQVIEVTNLNDSGNGSLRAAIETEGKRIIVFRISGTIKLKSDLVIKKPYITIAGQTAPGDGITLSDQPLKISGTHDVVVRYIRSRLGDTNCPDNNDALEVKDSQNVILDHVSTSWSIDETLSIRGEKTDNITVQWSIISESLKKSCHEKNSHGYGSILGGKTANKRGISVHHCLYAHHDSRNPRFSGQDDKSPGPIIDFRNNVIYNWGTRPGYPGNDEYPYINYIANYIKPGLSTYKHKNTAIVATWPGTNLYIEGNYHTMGTTDWNMIEGNASKSSSPFPADPVTTTDASQAYTAVLANAGCTLPKRDSVDKRIINDVKNNTGKIIDSQDDVGGWPKLNSTTPPTDSDHDGMPDIWEDTYEFNSHDASDNSQDADNDGYTNIEEFLNGTVPIEISPCVPDCLDKECGDDGCGGSCGSCTNSKFCNNSTYKCESSCTPNCLEKRCGDDGCGGSCGSCASGIDCINGNCIATKTDCSNADIWGQDGKPDGKVNILDVSKIISPTCWQQNTCKSVDMWGSEGKADGRVNLFELSRVTSKSCWKYTYEL